MISPQRLVLRLTLDFVIQASTTYFLIAGIFYRIWSTVILCGVFTALATINTYRHLDLWRDE
jgi:hypothetical protein